MQEHEAQSSSTEEITTSSAGQPKALIELIGNDGFAMSFQSVRQYRQALIRVVENTAPQPAEQQHAPDVAAHLVEALFLQYEANPHLTVGRWIEHGPFAELFAATRIARIQEPSHDNQ